MNFNSHQFSVLFEKTLIRIVADFGSDKDPKSVVSELSRDLKNKVSSADPGPYNFQIVRSDDGIYHFKSSFLLYRDARLITISLLKWIERSGYTNMNDNLFFDIKFIDEIKGPFKGTLFNTSTKIDNLDKLKFMLEFDEINVYKFFPERKNGFYSKSILNFDPVQKFIPKENQSIDPNLYIMPSTEYSGINFEFLREGFLRMQYIGGINYQTKINEILSIIDQFCVTSWECTINKGFSQKNILTFQKIIAIKEKIRESYYDYDLFQKYFPKVKFTVDLIDNKTTLYSYYQILRDKIYDIFSNIEFVGELQLNYDTTLSVFQIKDSNLKCKGIKPLQNLEFIKSKIEFGILDLCDFYDSEIKNAKLIRSNLFLHSIANKCNLVDSFSNRTTKLINSSFYGANGVMNGRMEGGLFHNGKIGKHTEISDTTTVIEYQKMKVGFIVAADQVIIPTKKFIKE